MDGNLYTEKRYGNYVAAKKSTDKANTSGYRFINMFGAEGRVDRSRHRQRMNQTQIKTFFGERKRVNDAKFN